MVAAYHPLSKTTRAAIGRCARAARALDESGWASRVAMVSPICKNRPTPSEGDFGILEPAAGYPRRRFGRGIECRNRLPGGLVQVGDALATREAQPAEQGLTFTVTPPNQALVRYVRWWCIG
jgi:hypothetical protein